MILGLCLAWFLYFLALAVLCVVPVEWFVPMNDRLVRAFVKTNITHMETGPNRSISVHADVRYRFGGSIVLGAWLGTLHAVAFLRGL